MNEQQRARLKFEAQRLEMEAAEHGEAAARHEAEARVERAHQERLVGEAAAMREGMSE